VDKMWSIDPNVNVIYFLIDLVSFSKLKLQFSDLLNKPVMNEVIIHACFLTPDISECFLLPLLLMFLPLF
jgi:hypothetical protein